MKNKTITVTNLKKYLKNYVTAGKYEFKNDFRLRTDDLMTFLSRLELAIELEHHDDLESCDESNLDPRL
jgi:hypothetical protein